MKTNTSHTALITVSMISLLAGTAASQGKSDKRNSDTWVEHVNGEEILVEGTLNKIKQPVNGYSARYVQDQKWRSDFRERIGWVNLPRSIQEAIWDRAVGPDQVDQNGINLVSLAWSYTKSVRAEDHLANDLVLNYDGDAVLIGSDIGGNNADPGFSRLFVTELDGAANASDGWTENWERAPYYTGSGSDGYVSAERGAVDFNGNTYTCGMRSDGRFTVWKFDGETGTTLWSRNGEVLNGTDAIATDIAVDPEGVVYVSGSYTNSSTNNDSWFIARLNPDDGSIDWIKEPPVPGEPIGGIEFDRKGDLFIGGYAPGAHIVAKLRAVDGNLIWVDNVNASNPSGNYLDSLKLDSDGNPHFTARLNGSNGGWRTTKWDGESGDQLWSQTTGAGRPKDLEVDGYGNVYVCGDSSNNTFKLNKYDSDGNLEWTFATGSTGVASDIALDRLGNVYMTGDFGGGDNNPKLMTTKHDPVDGSIVWEMINAPSRPNENNLDFKPQDIIVDAGGNVYVAGHRAGRDTNNGATGIEFFMLKYEQPYVSIPLITRSYPQLSLEGRSVWDPDNSSGLNGFSYEQPLFTLRSSDVISRSDINDRLDARVDYGLGVIEGGVKLRTFSGRVDVSLQAHASAGDFDASTTGELAIAVPAESELFAGQDFDITLNWDPDEFATDLLSNLEPRLEGGLYGNASLDIDADLDIDKGNGTNIVDTGIIDANVDFAEDFNGGDDLNILGVDFDNLPPGGVWYDPVQFPWTRFFSGKVRSPILKTEGAYDESTGAITSSLREKFFDGKVRVTELLLAYFGQGPMSFNWSPAGGSDDFNADVDAGLIQADIDGRLYMLQDLDLQVRPYVRLQFATDGDTTPDNARIEFYNNSGDPVDQRTHTVRMPDNGELEITPIFGADLTLINSSGLEIELVSSFDVARFEASASALGVDLISIDKCIGCTEDSISFEVRDQDLGFSINEDFAFPNEHQLSPIQVLGDTNLQPQLIGGSRVSVPMRIYNQRTPSQSQFNDMASGVTPMVLYGYKFFSGTNIKVKIEHHGRIENLERTRLNDQALLIQIPNRFFLLPGMARLWITNDNGISESIDLAVEYPFPNFEGIEETFWASDPRWAEEPIVIVDGGTPARNDSFIARRDYYDVLQNTLWNSTILSDLGNPNQTANQYFSAFTGWDVAGQEQSLPGFPSVVLDGVSLSRRNQDSPSGQLHMKSAEELVSKSGFKDMVLCNPGPGGGMSRNRVIEVPAPKPVIWEVTPDLYTPGEVDTDSKGFVRMRVLGPDTVPFFAGYEAPKYGNFTPRSVVRVDGNVVSTEFINSGELVARVPSGAFNGFGRRVVDVVTPNVRGTRFKENLIDGNGNDQGISLVSSGGRSEPYVVEMLWPTPEVEFVSHTMIELGVPPYTANTIDGEPALDDHNITLEGSHFAPGCVVFVNGRSIPSTRDTDSIVRATIGVDEVSSLGTAYIWVGNPPPSVRTSDPVAIQIVPATAP